MGTSGCRAVQHRQERVTTAAEKVDRRAEFAFDLILRLVKQGNQSPERYYEAALLIGDKYYEELAADTAHELNTYRTAIDVLLGELESHLRSGARPPSLPRSAAVLGT